MNFILMLLVLSICAPAAAEVDFVKEQTTLHIGPNDFLVMNILRPKNAAPKSVPAVLLFGGFETSDKSIDLVHPDRPVMVVTFAYPFRGPKKVSILRDYKMIPEIKKALHQTLRGIRQLVEWAGHQPEVDAAQVYLVGVSFGAPLAAMSVSEGIRGLILVHGFIDVESTMAYSLGVRFGKSYGALGRLTAKILSKLAWWYMGLPSPKKTLSQLKFGQRVLVYTSEKDDLLPASAAEDIRHVLTHADVEWEERFMPGEHIRSSETDTIQRLVTESLDWIFSKIDH